MDATRFDALLRSLTVSPSRRAIARTLTALVVGGALGPAALETEAQKKCGKCKKRKNGKCKPKQDGTKCGNCKECKNGKCQNSTADTKCGETPADEECGRCQDGSCVPVADGSFCPGFGTECKAGRCECEFPPGEGKDVGA
jgi:hypothetical protein